VSRILIVEDEEPFSRYLTLLLRIQGHEAHVARGVSEGAGEIRSWEPDLMVLDLCLEAEDGGDLLQLARATGFCSPVIVYSKADPVAATSVTGAEAWLMTPFDTDALVQRAGRLLDH
jgi:DNA-binding response OmpR family regulator